MLAVRNIWVSAFQSEPGMVNHAPTSATMKNTTSSAEGAGRRQRGAEIALPAARGIESGGFLVSTVIISLARSRPGLSAGALVFGLAHTVRRKGERRLSAGAEVEQVTLLAEGLTRLA